MEKEVIITSTLRHKIRLPLERWEHYALKSYDSTPVGKKTCVVIYKDIVDGFIITALLTSKPEQLQYGKSRNR